MKVSEAPLSGILIIEPDVYSYDRGFFMESWSAKKYRDIGIPEQFVQDNVSFSKKGVLRGLHFQSPSAQGKLVSVLIGEVFDVAVDLRRDSSTFRKWFGEYLSSDNRRQVYLPSGFAHGFVVTSENALFAYKCTEFYNKYAEKTILWSDPDIGIVCPVENPQVSKKDAAGKLLRDIGVHELF